MKRISSFMAAACLAWPCFAAPEEGPRPQPLRPPSLQVQCANENLSFVLTRQIDACLAVVAAPETPKDERTQTYLRLGHAYLRGMMYERAIGAFNAAIRLSPQSGLAFGGRGKAHLARDEIYQGIADFDYALKLDDSLDLYAERGAALVKVGKPEDAASDFTNALARRPNDAALLAQRGVEYFKAGQPEQASADLERAIALDPSLAQHPSYGPFIAEFVRPRRR